MQGSGSQFQKIMAYHLPLGKWLMGIPVEVHWSLVLVPLFIYSLLTEGGAGSPMWYPMVQSVWMTAAIFLFVYLHECGHAFAFRAYNLPVSRISLGFLGGTCHGGWPRSPREEIVITFFGPLVNLVFVVVFLSALFGWQWALHMNLRPIWTETTFISWRYVGMELITFLFLVNFAQAAFNLITPIFPMDCARILRATLAKWYAPAKATRAAIYVGYVVGALFIAGAVLEMIFGDVSDGFFWVLLVIVLWMSARQEWERVKYQPVYQPASSLYLSSWRELDEESEDWRAADKPNPKPGFFARWVVKQQQKKAELAQRKAEETRARVDQLLEKISHEGITALSQKERDFLSSASKSFRNRVS
ncbi:MAG: site-2 protease family protein [Planctomycetota bacterium]